jgi:hypothetical protein
MEGGVRILTMRDGLPHSVYFISHSPIFRESELARLTLPEEAAMYGDCDWLRQHLTHAEVIPDEYDPI